MQRVHFYKSGRKRVWDPGNIPRKRLCVSRYRINLNRARNQLRNARIFLYFLST